MGPRSAAGSEPMGGRLVLGLSTLTLVRAAVPPRPSPATPRWTATPSCGSWRAAAVTEHEPDLSLPLRVLARGLLELAMGNSPRSTETSSAHPNDLDSRSTPRPPCRPATTSLVCSSLPLRRPGRGRRLRGAASRRIREALGKRPLVCTTVLAATQFEGNLLLRCLGRASGVGGGSWGNNRLRARSTRDGLGAPLALAATTRLVACSNGLGSGVRGR